LNSAPGDSAEVVGQETRASGRVRRQEGLERDSLQGRAGRVPGSALVGPTEARRPRESAGLGEQGPQDLEARRVRFDLGQGGAGQGYGRGAADLLCPSRDEGWVEGDALEEEFEVVEPTQALEEVPGGVQREVDEAVVSLEDAELAPPLCLGAGQEGLGSELGPEPAKGAEVELDERTIGSRQVQVDVVGAGVGRLRSLFAVVAEGAKCREGRLQVGRCHQEVQVEGYALSGVWVDGLGEKRSLEDGVGHPSVAQRRAGLVESRAHPGVAEARLGRLALDRRAEIWVTEGAHEGPDWASQGVGGSELEEGGRDRGGGFVRKGAQDLDQVLLEGGGQPGAKGAGARAGHASSVHGLGREGQRPIQARAGASSGARRALAARIRSRLRNHSALCQGAGSALRAQPIE
jgi:hypothetical protein